MKPEMKCYKCGTEIFDNASFCFNCGAPLSTNKAQKQSGRLIRKICTVICLASVVVPIIVYIVVFSVFDPLNRNLNVGYKHLDDRKPKEAITYFNKALDHDFENIDALLGKVEAYTALDKSDKVLETLEEILEIDENNEQAKLLYDEFLKEHSEGYEIKMMRESEDNPEAHGVIECLDGNRTVWEYRTESITKTELDPISDIYFDDNKVYFAEKGNLIALDKATGEKLWTVYNVGWGNSIVLDDNNVYISGYYGPNAVVVSKDGTELYRDNDQFSWGVHKLALDAGLLVAYCDEPENCDSEGRRYIDISEYL